MAKWRAEWSGAYPNLCSGEWTLFKDDEEVHTEIPFQGNDANTLGEYSEWYFDEDYSDEWELYLDGIGCTKWIGRYQEWLNTLSSDPEDWRKIYHAFNACDWRSGSCGGCI